MTTNEGIQLHYKENGIRCRKVLILCCFNYGLVLRFIFTKETMPPFPSKLRQNMDSLRTVVLSITEYSWMKRMELIVVHSLLIGRIPLEKEGGMGVKQQYTEYNRTNCIING